MSLVLAQVSIRMIQTEGLNKFYKGAEKFHALRDVSLEIAKGEFVAITGQSGSGKSTLLYVLSTLDTDYSGKISVNKRVLNEMNSNQLSELRNRDIGFVFQFHYLLPEFSVLENVCLPAMKLKKYTPAQIRERAVQKLEMLGLADQIDKKGGQLSGGQQQRVAIARALINDPVIIFGDEPTGNLDSQNAKMVFDIFKELSEKHEQTIVIVTHDPGIAAKSDRCITLKDGRIV
ncbi:MAG TPA: ABC transporter ATP-binding protein [Catalimonadaceae bacterium]|nr:ABC transporter ATP-binding protein [Catalimonadaceae bacterium]